METRSQARSKKCTMDSSELQNASEAPLPSVSGIAVGTSHINIHESNNVVHSRATSVTSSCRSSATIKARKLAAKAQHARLTLELEQKRLAQEQKIAEKQQAVLDIELQAQLASIDSASNNGSMNSNHSEVSEWLVRNVPNLDVAQTTLPKIGCPASHVVAGTVDVAPPLFDNFTMSNNNVIPLQSQITQYSPPYIQNEPEFPAEGMMTSMQHFPTTATTSATPHIYSQDTTTQDVARPKNQTVTYFNNTNTLPDKNISTSQDDSISKLAKAISSLSRSPHAQHLDIRLNIFDGKSPAEWLSFKRSFEDTKAFYSATQNIARLNYAIRGVARDAVYRLLLTAQDPEEVMRALEIRFARPERIVLEEIAGIKALPKINNDCGDINIFACKVKNCVETIRLLNQNCYLESPELLNILVSKLNYCMRSRWMEFAASHVPGHNKGNILVLSDFLMREAELQIRFGLIHDSKLSITVGQNHNDINRRRDNVNFVALENSSKNNNVICSYCQQCHNIINCQTFLARSIDDRWRWVKENKVCHRCLIKGGHTYRLCKPKTLCKINGCKFKHHKLLHKDEQSLNNNSSVDIQEVSDVVTHLGTPNHTDPDIHTFRPKLKIIPVTLKGPKGSVETFALLDDGSTATLVDSDICKKIGASGRSGVLNVDFIGGMSKQTTFQYVDFYIKGLYTQEFNLIRNAKSISELGLSRQTISVDNINKYNHLSNIKHMLCYNNAQPTIIIGVDNWHLIIPSEVRKGSRSEPVALNTKLGWVLFGFGCSRSKIIDFINYDSCNDNINNLNDTLCLESLIKEHYKLDSIGITKKELRSDNDNRAIDIINETVRRLPSGRFEVGLLWQNKIKNIPNSYNLALTRFLSLERKFLKDNNYAELYKQNIKNIIEKGYAEECDNFTSNFITWYLPHFGVINPNKPGKLRVVHDAAAKSNNVSFNSLLLSGPDILQSLISILMRFREGRIAVTADIREMFPQIKIIERDRDAQRFLWRANPNKPIKIFRMSSMIFGAASSPFTALYIKNKNALEVENEHPEAVHAILYDHYMDDYIGSFNNIEDAARVTSDIVNIHKKAHFEMRGWLSNNPKALINIPKNLLLYPKLNVDLGNYNFLQSVRTLGIIWQPMQDTISFNISTPDELPDKLTKRNVLSYLMRVYDPLGILTPLIVRGRILFQKAWRSSISWDDELSQIDTEQWRNWFQDISLITELQIPRCYLCKLDPIERELHTFCDASEQAYAAVAYWRLIYPNEMVKLALISGKARVAPLKPVSIPRLELQGALVAARLASTICEAHRNKPCKIFFWCDSMTVLGWLRSDARCYKPFVAHRVGEILELTNVSQWSWIPSSLNVADDATRLNSGSLSLKDRWISGPEFLLSSSKYWPSEPQENISHCKDELKPAHRLNLYYVNITSILPTPLSANPDRFSKWLRLVRVTATAHQYIKLLKIKCLKNKGLDVRSIVLNPGSLCSFSVTDMSSPLVNINVNNNNCKYVTLTANDLSTAVQHILRRCQMDSFAEELILIKSQQALPRQSKLFNLSPELNHDGLIHLRGRISAVQEVSDNTKSPVILDGNHPVTRLLIEFYHEKSAHANNEMVINELRQNYWILSLRNAVRKISNKCMFCRIRRTTPMSPPIGNLPEARLAHHKRPFTFVGLDYLGPLQVTVGRRQEKRYVALYTCLTCRAVHLEIVHTLSADSAILSLRRFISRRGTPFEIISDNGTAFVGAQSHLKALYNISVEDFVANKGIKWSFIPPSAPFMGGAWERLVKSVKIALSVTLKSRAPREEVLLTLLAEAECLINSRPLTHVSVDPRDPESITPFHFILGSSSGASPTIQLDDKDLLRRCDWKKALRLADHFWRRWVQEYLPTLQLRRNPKLITKNLAVGDLVLIVDGNLPRGAWPRGMIIKVYPGPDGSVRVADVQTAGGILKRPSKKLVLILENKEMSARIHYVL